MKMRAFAAFLAGFAVALPSGRAAPPGFDALVDEYYADYSLRHPSGATELGIHDHDSDLDDLSPEAIENEKTRLQSFAKRFAALDAKNLEPRRAADLAFVRTAIGASLFELEDMEGLRRHPSHYPGLANGAVYSLMKRAFAPEEKRLESVIARTEKVPQLLAQGKKNLFSVPKPSCEIAIEEIPGIIDFFNEDVAKAFPSAMKGDASTRYRKACGAAVAALEDYRAFLKEKILPEANPSFGIGHGKLAAKLKADEMIETPLEELRASAKKELARLQDEFKKTAAQIDPKKPFREVQAALGSDHPPADKVIQETQDRLTALRKFLIHKDIVTLPSDAVPKVLESPPFMRGTTLASMSTPGPFEKEGTEAIFHITLPDPSWPKERAENYLAGALNRTTMDVTAIHEALPGHFVQFLWLPRVDSKVRKFEGSYSNSEGWAHYCEQMILDEGWGDGDPKLRLAQLQDALLRAARYVAAIEMHGHMMKLEAADRFFHEEGYQSEEVALIEARRGVEDPTYMVYTWAKLELLKLREDYKKKLGKDFTLKRFHDAILAEGSIPIPLLRAALLK